MSNVSDISASSISLIFGRVLYFRATPFLFSPSSALTRSASSTRQLPSLVAFHSFAAFVPFFDSRVAAIGSAAGQVPHLEPSGEPAVLLLSTRPSGPGELCPRKFARGAGRVLRTTACMDSAAGPFDALGRREGRPLLEELFVLLQGGRLGGDVLS